MQSDKLVTIIRGSTDEVFSMMLGLAVEHGEPQTNRDPRRTCSTVSWRW